MTAEEIMAALEGELARSGRNPYAAAIAAGLPGTAIRQALEHRSPRLPRLVEICHAIGLDIRLVPLAHRSAETNSGETRHVFRKGADWDTESGAYATSLASRGARFSAQGCAWFGAGVLTQLDLDPEHCRAVEALDDSMAPRIPAASVTLADFRRREPRDGGIFVIGPERSPTLRQLTSVKKSWMAEAVNPMWPARRISKDEILGEGLWRSMALPPGPMTPPARDPGPTVSVTQMQTEGLKPWPVPYRSPGDPLQFEPDRVAWFEVGFLHALQIEPLNAEVVIVTDSLMMPTLWPSAAVLINRRRTAPRDGMICGLWSGGTVVPRRLISDETGWRVAADAPAAPTRPLRLGESIVGEAVWTGAFLPGGAADRENE